MNRLQTTSCSLLSICLIVTVFRFVGAKIHFRFHDLSVFGHDFLLNKLCQIFERYLTKCVLFLTHILSWILHKYESAAFRHLTRAQNTIWNRPLYEMSNSYSENAQPSSIYTRLNTRYVIPWFSYTDTLFEWSQMKIIKHEFPIFWYETFLLSCLCLKQVYCCLTFVCVYIWLLYKMLKNARYEKLELYHPLKSCSLALYIL